MARGMIHRLIDVFEEISRELQVPCSCAQVESMALVIHRAMSFQSRQFHTLDHVFSFLENADAHTALAAVFHDLIYFQVDQGLQDEIRPLLESWVEVREGQVWLVEGPQDPLVQGLKDIFGFQAPRNLSAGPGLNEFLSALVMVRMLDTHLKPLDLMITGICIEATIPFRKKDAAGLSPFEVLRSRVQASTTLKAWGLEGEVLDQALLRAVKFSNQDVADFALEDPAAFLNNTWKLLPELNSALRGGQGAYSITEYRQALGNMEKFFCFLDPEGIFHQYNNYPAPEVLMQKQARCRDNLAVSREYLQAKLLAAGLLEALALVSGGEAPMALFMGDIPREGEPMDRLEDHLEGFALDSGPRDATKPVYQLLAQGRLDDSNFDLKNSPLALYIYQRLGDEEFHTLVTRAKEFFHKTRTPEDFLKDWPGTLRSAVVRGLRALVRTRREALEPWA